MDLIFLRVCLLAFAIAKCVSASGTKDFILFGKSFTIKTTVVYQEFGVPSVAHLTESYSRGLRRARLDYSIKDSTIIDEFYYDPTVGTGINLSRIFKSCSKVDLNALYYNVYLNSKEVNNLFKLADESIKDVDYIIGPSKLLFLVASQADKLQVMLDPNKDKDKEVTIRGHPSIQYRLDLQLASDLDEKAEIFVFYDKMTHNSNKQPIENLIPLQIYINYPNNLKKQFLLIDYYSTEIFPGVKVHPKFDLADKNELILIDQFSYPTSYECSESIDDSKKKDLFEQYDLSSIKFSFIAISKPILGRMLKHFVAYDGMTTSLRIDTQWRTHRELNYARDYVQILDFKTNRKYTYTERKDFDGENNKLLSLKDKKSKCSVSFASDPDKAVRDSLNLSKFLTGVQKFTFMGHGQVRGVNARIYEGKSDSVPYWFGQPMLFKDRNNNYRYKVSGDMIKENPARELKSDYSVVFYIRDDNLERVGDSQPGIKPLLLEYYDLRLDKSSGYRRSLVMRVNDFIWDLNSSPNGDNPTDLFSVKDHCSSGSGADKYAEVDLLLEEETSNKEEEEVTDSNLDWIFNNIQRNEALVSSIRDVMDIQNVMMYDLQSKVAKFNNKRKIMASFRVAEHPRDLYQLTFIGNAQLNRAYTDKALIVNSLTITECLWLVGDSRKPIYLYYSQLSMSCIFDTELTDSPSVDIRDSTLFNMVTDEVGELYRVENHFDRETSLSNSWLRDEKFTHLENREMILQSIQQGDPIQPINPNDIRMRIKRVKINNVNFMNKIGQKGEQKQIKPAVKVYSGFNLPTSFDNSGQTKIYKLKTTEIISQEQCHAACLADLNCKSFSYCVQLPDTSCVLSTIGFEAPGIREHLESQDIQNLARGSKVLVKTMDFSIELIRDFRCELYNKIYIDLYSKTASGMFPLRNLVVFPAKNEESCAKMCFAKSLESIKSSIALGKQIKTVFLEEDDNKRGDKSESDLIKELHNDYSKAASKFCQFFLYLDTTLSAEEQNILKQVVDKSGSTTTGLVDSTSEYCAFKGETNRNSDEKLESFEFLFNKYKFQFKMLYEKRYGYVLKRSVLSPQEEEAYKNVVQKKGIQQDQYELLKNSLSEGKNFQNQLYFDTDTCAFACFFQYSGLWPACRSFDNLLYYYKYESSITLDNMCYLNTEIDSRNQFSTADFELVTRSVQIWHYMPRFGSISEQGDDYYDLGILDEKIDKSKNAKQGPSEAIGGIFTLILNVLEIIFLLSLGMLCGLYLGCKLTERFVGGRFGERMPDTVMLAPTL